METQPESNDFRRQKTTTILVHGVSQHTECELLDCAQKGFRRTFHDQTYDSERHVICRKRSAGHPRELPVLSIHAGGESHLITVFNWTWASWLRPFASIQESIEKEVSLLSILLLVLSPLLLLLPAIDLFVLTVLCAVKAKGIVFKLGVLLLGMLLVNLLFFVVVSLTGLTADVLTLGVTSVPWLQRIVGQHLWIWLLVLWLLLSVAVNVFRWLFRTLEFLAWGIELAADVIAYVGSLDRRRKSCANLLRLVDFVESREPDSRIILVAHSLGTVLAAHALLRLAESKEPSRSISLVTLGSPLALLSRVFPGAIPIPSVLLSRLEEKGTIATWANFWRARDPIRV